MKVLKPNLILQVEGVGRAWPEGPAVTNYDLLSRHPETAGKPEKMLREFEERIGRAYGFRERYMTRKPWEGLRSGEETSESLALRALQSALGDSWRKRAPDAFLLGTTTTRRYTGSQATSVLGKFPHEAPAWELKAGCSTSLATLHMSHALFKQGYERVSVACAETLSKVIHPSVRETWFGLADGGAAIAFRRVASKGHFKVLRTVYSTDGRQVDLYTTPGDLPPTKETLEAHGYSLSGDASQLKDLAKARYMEMIAALLPSKKERESVKWLIPHQVNRLLIDEVYAQSGLKAEVLWDAEKFGNIGGSSVLFTFARAIEEKRFRKGEKILFMSVGGGLSFAAQLWQKL